MKDKLLLALGAVAILPLLFVGCGDSDSSLPTSPGSSVGDAGKKPGGGSSGEHVQARVGIPGHFFLEAETEGCTNRKGPRITLSGELTLGGMQGKLIFRNNRQGTHEAEAEATASVVLLEEGEKISFAKQPSRGGVGGNPHLFMELIDGKGHAMSEEIYLGRCVQGLMTSQMDLVMDALASADISAADCSNSGGPMITVDGDLRLGGLGVNLIFRNNVQGTHEYEEEGEVAIVIIPEESPLVIPKPPPFGGATGNPHIFFVFTDGDGEPVSGEFYLGRCVQLSK